MDKEQGNKDNYQTRRFHELNASLSGNINIDASDLTEYRELLEILLRSRSITWEEIPSEVIIKHSEIRREAIRQKEWHKVVLALNVAANAVDVQSMLSDLTEFYKQYLWSDVTEDALRRHISLWQLEKPERQVRCLVTGNTPATSDELDRVGKVLSKATEHERRYFIEIIPDNQLGHPAIFSHLSPEEQVRCCWERLLTQDDEWVKLSSRAKILAIYRGLYEGVQLLAPLKYFKGDSIALYVHKIYSLRDKADDVKVVGFRDAHQRLQDYVIDTVFE